ncbi:natural killer cells antigen CD94 [Bubalus kerabau]|uniref:natural killer cells antigen CD94 n=1 Tax=Bubalus carabanensis TaxID=3119969 RepID=UPI00244EB70E|nr:natural killer cells antigen CD94 [Bubalus carabanensis]
MAAFQTTAWRLISGVLGVICLVLMAALGVLLKNSLTKQSVQPGPSSDLQEEYNLHEEEESCLGCSGSGCYSCQEKWIGYQCNCYFVSNEFKTWKDSRDFCVSHNSSLLQIQTRNELAFMKFSTSFYWIGLSYDEEHHDWLWEDNSTLSRDLLPFFKSVNPKNCIMYIPRGRILDAHCEKKFRYICKQQLI